MPPWCRWDGDDLVLSLRVQPRASRDELAGPHGDRLRVRVTAPPVDGRANAHLLRFLASAFGVPPAGVRLEGGETGRDKVVRVVRPRRFPAAAGKAEVEWTKFFERH
jgi:uncharacterized protein (TIGR00251 family)